MLAKGAAYLPVGAVAARDRLAPAAEPPRVNEHPATRQHVDLAAELSAGAALVFEHVAARRIPASRQDEPRRHVPALARRLAARARALAHGDECNLAALDPCRARGTLLDMSEDSVRFTRQRAVDVQLGVAQLRALEAPAGVPDLVFVFEPGAYDGVLTARVFAEHQHVVGGRMVHPCVLATGHYHHPHRLRRCHRAHRGRLARSRRAGSLARSRWIGRQRRYQRPVASDVSWT